MHVYFVVAFSHVKINMHACMFIYMHFYLHACIFIFCLLECFVYAC